jgi:hypothetical protein
VASWRLQDTVAHQSFGPEYRLIDQAFREFDQTAHAIDRFPSQLLPHQYKNDDITNQSEVPSGFHYPALPAVLHCREGIIEDVYLEEAPKVPWCLFCLVDYLKTGSHWSQNTKAFNPDQRRQ